MNEPPVLISLYAPPPKVDHENLPLWILLPEPPMIAEIELPGLKPELYQGDVSISLLKPPPINPALPIIVLPIVALLKS